MVKQLANAFVFLSLILLSACQSNLSPQPVSAQQTGRPLAIADPGDRSPLKLPLVKPKIVVKKAQRQLLLYSADKLVRRYRIGLGLSPVGDKVRQGDRRTPEGDFYIFMVPDNFEQYTAGKAAVGDGAQWLKDGVVCIVTLWNNEPLVVTPPPHIDLKVIETDPGLRGDTATGGQKTAKLETGAVVRVPLFINEGEVLRIDTRTGQYISRSKS